MQTSYTSFLTTLVIKNTHARKHVIPIQFLCSIQVHCIIIEHGIVWFYFSFLKIIFLLVLEYKQQNILYKLVEKILLTQILEGIAWFIAYPNLYTHFSPFCSELCLPIHLSILSYLSCFNDLHRKNFTAARVIQKMCAQGWVPYKKHVFNHVTSTCSFVHYLYG